MLHLQAQLNVIFFHGQRDASQDCGIDDQDRHGLGCVHIQSRHTQIDRTCQQVRNQEQRQTIVESSRPVSESADDRVEHHEMVTIRMGNKMEQL